MSDHTTKAVPTLLALAAKLQQSQRVQRLLSRDRAAQAEDVATEAADSLLDICRSAEVIRADLLPKLLAQDPEGGEFDETLNDVAEELRHINYHVTNTKLFSYILPAP